MSWIAITSSFLLEKVTGPEKTALSGAALGAGQTDPLTDIILNVVREVRGYCGGRFTLGTGDTIPSELLDAALAMIRYRAYNRLPVGKGLLTQTRIEEYNDALVLMRDVARGNFAIVPAETAATEQATVTSPVITPRRRRFRPCDEEGI